MKKNMTWARNGVLFMALSLCALTTGAQEAEPTTFGVWTAQMQTIARNNASLRALHSSLEATRLANGADNALPDPEAEVAYMFGSPKGVPNRTNVAVTQTLPWGVLTGHRSRLSKAANSSVAATYRVAFQRVMGEADAALVSMVHLNRLCSELESRLAQARDIASMYEKKFKDGDISIVELNKVRLNASVAEAELQRAKADRHAAGQTLQALNGGQPLAVADTLYPVAAALPPLDVLKADLARSAAVTQAEASVAESEAAIKLAKTEGLPQLTVGFQGEYIKDNNYSRWSWNRPMRKPWSCGPPPTVCALTSTQHLPTRSCAARSRQDSCRCSTICLSSRSTIRPAPPFSMLNAMLNWLCLSCGR